MVSFGEKEYEPMPKAEVLGVGKSLLAAPGSLPLGDIDAVLVDQLAIDRRGRVPFVYMARDVPVVAMSQVAGCNQLDDCFGGCCFASIFHVPPKPRANALRIIIRIS
jgi:hypothetical protein